MANKNTKAKLPTAKDFEDVFSGFTSERDRIKCISKAYENMSITEAFAKFYGLDLTSSAGETNTIISIEVGEYYTGTVTSLNKSGLTFTVPGVKEEIVSKENFTDCIDAVQNYLLNHDNKLKFVVKEKRHNVYYVSVLNAYYKMWMDEMEKSIKYLNPIDVHVDSLTNGGYLCHTPITTLVDLTGKNYTSSVFIPGSNIVLNIERNFERWVGQDIQVIPQKFTKFKQPGNEVENSIIGSRKLVLQMKGTQNLYEIYNRAKLVDSFGSNNSKEVFDGTVTGIINSNKNTGIFVELNDKYITGLMPIDASDLLDYKPGDQIKVKVKMFEVADGKDPFVFNKKNQLVYSNTRCVFEIAK